MKISKRNFNIISAVVLFTTLLTIFFYVHESFPKPIRAATALLGTPTAIASGLSYYLHLGIPVYETPWAVVLTNFIFSVPVIILIDKIFFRGKNKIKKI
jgi:hypothetical protein